MLRTRHFVGAVLASTCLTAPSFSQAFSAPPPEHFQIDANHVDRASGAVVYTAKELSIGPDGRGGLSLVHYHNSAQGVGGPYGTNWDLAIYAAGSTYYVNYGDGVSDIFALSGGVFTSQTGSGATLSLSGSTYTYTASDGTQVVYGYTTQASQQAAVAHGTQITYPTGEVVKLVWRSIVYTNCPISSDNCSGYSPLTAVRLTSVSHSNGYQFHYFYQLNDEDQGTKNQFGAKWQTVTKIMAINTAVDYCDPTAELCGTLTQTPATVSYTNSLNSTGSVTDPLGRVTVYGGSLNAGGFPISFSVQRPGSTSPDYSYSLDASMRPTQLVADGQTYGYATSLSGTILSVTETDPLGHTDATTADQSIDQIKTHTDGDSHTTTYQYDSQGRLQYLIAPEGTITGGTPTAGYTKLTYDSRGNITEKRQVAKSGLSAPDIVESAIYPTTCTNIVMCNKPTSTTDADSNTTSYTYDPTHGGVLTVTQPAVGGVAPQTRYTYTQYQAYYKNSAGSIVASGVSEYQLTATSACRTTASCIGTADENKTTIGYGPQAAGTANNLLPVSSTSGAGDGSLTATSSATYDIVGNIATVTDPLSNVTAYFFDADREPLGAIGPDPDGAGPLKMRATRLTYNADAFVTLAEQGTATANTPAAFNAMTTLQQVATTYDASDRKVQDSAQAGGTTYAVVQYSYDAASRLQCSAQRMNPSVFTSLPSSACTLGTSGSYGPDRISYDTYDSANQLLKVTSAYGVTTANGFPATLQRDETTYTYNPNGTIATLADAKSNLTSYFYDGFDRLLQTQYPSPTAAGTSNASDYEQLTYDAASNVTARRLRDGNSISYGYDALNRMSSKTRLATEPSVSYTYDNLGHPSKFKQGNSSLITFSVDALGRETSEVQPYGTMSYQYDLAGNRTRLTWGDGIYVTYDYDAAHEMTAVHENGGTVIVSLTYDDLGRRATRTYGSGAVSTYNYDAISRLTSIALTGASNLNTTTLSNYSPAGEIGSKANTSDTYAWTLGANANRGYTTNGLNQYTAIAGSGVGYDAKGNVTTLSGLTYTYSSENLLTSINTSTPTNFYYDALNRLAELDDSTAKVRFVYDGDDIVQEVFLNGTVARRYVPGPLPDETLVWYDGTGTGSKRYFDQDERGSTTRVSNQSGTSWSIDSYDEYGTPGSSNSGRFEYTGYAIMDTAGIYYAKARMYSPALGRFLQTDPIGYRDGPNWYNYARGNPVNGLDPSGLDDVIAPPFTVTGNPSGGEDDQDDSSGDFSSGDFGGPGGLGAPENGEVERAIEHRLARRQARQKIPPATTTSDQDADAACAQSPTGCINVPGNKQPPLPSDGSDTVAVSPYFQLTRDMSNEKGGPGQPGICVAARDMCVSNAEKLHDSGNIPGSHELYKGCIFAYRQCEGAQSEYNSGDVLFGFSHFPQTGTVYFIPGVPPFFVKH